MSRGQQSDVQVIGFVIGFLLFLISLGILNALDAGISWMANLAGQTGGLPVSVFVVGVLISILVGVIGYIATIVILLSLE